MVAVKAIGLTDYIRCPHLELQPCLAVPNVGQLSEWAISPRPPPLALLVSGTWLVAKGISPPAAQDNDQEL